MNEKVDPQVVRLPIKLLKVDKYQKKLRSKVINKIVNNFDPVVLGLIHVSLRDDGSYWIFDGQNRTEALKKIGFEYADCLVFTGLTYQQEAKAFNAHQNSSKPTKVEEHRARVEAEDILSLEIEDVLHSMGLEFSNATSKTRMKTVTTVYEIYDGLGKDGLIELLNVMCKSFGNEDKPFVANVMRGLNDVMKEYGSKVNDKWLIKQLSKITTNDLNLRANGFKDVHGFSKRQAMKMAITQCYNHRKSERLKLK